MLVQLEVVTHSKNDILLRLTHLTGVPTESVPDADTLTDI